MSDVSADRSAALFSTRGEFTERLYREPLIVQALGLGPGVVIANSAAKALALGAATLAVVTAMSLIVSLLGRQIPVRFCTAWYWIISAALVTLADYGLRALVPDVHRELGIYISLIVVTSVLLVRQERLASPVSACRAALQAGGGFLLILFILGSSREALGSGSVFGFMLFGPRFDPWRMLLLPGGGFLVLSVLLSLLNWRQARRKPGATENAP